MGFLDRTRTIGSPRTSRPAASADGRTGVQLLEAADTAYAMAEQEFDRSPETREELETAYLTAASALDAERHPRRASAWLGLATVRRYQKGRRDDALNAYDAALTAGPDNIEIWEAYLDYITYAISAAALLAIVKRMPAPVRAHTLPQIVSVGRGTDRWGTMSLDDQRRFTDALPGLLEALDDRPSLGALLSTNAMDEYRNGSHSQAHQLMRRAVATGHPSPACVDRLTIDLVKLGEKNDAAVILRDALTRPIPSDSMRSRMTKRLARCSAGQAPNTDTVTESPSDDRSEVLDRAAGTRHLRPGENAVLR